MTETSKSLPDWREERAEKLRDNLSLVQLVAKGWIDGATTLSDSELSRIMSSEEEVSGLLGDLSFSGIRMCREEVSYRRRREELASLPTDELQVQSTRIREHRARMINDDYHDDLPDSFFESSPKDSDERIISELLEERAISQPAE